MNKRRKIYDTTLFPLFFSVLLFAAVLLLFLWGIGTTERQSKAENLRTAQQSVRNAAISCYALEGHYPQSYDYLKKNYALSVNEDKYAVFYTIFASNILPDISVVEK